MAINGATVTVTGDEIAGKWFKATNYSQDVGSKYSYEQSKLLLGNADTKKITINNSSKDLDRFGSGNRKTRFCRFANVCHHQRPGNESSFRQ